MAIYGECQECKQYGKVHVHHKDGKHSNDVEANRVALCPRCHVLAHSVLGIGTKKAEAYLPPGWKPPPMPMDVVRSQYYQCFPRS